MTSCHRLTIATAREKPIGTDGFVNHYFFEEIFRDPSARTELLSPLTPSTPLPSVTIPKGLPSYMNHLWEVPLLSPGQERTAFRRLNYLKYLCEQLRLIPASSGGCVDVKEDRNDLIRQSLDVRNQLIEANLRLVIAIAKRVSKAGGDEFDEMVGVGNAALVRAVDLFDYRRGTRFSTYAYQAIHRSMIDVHRKESRIRRKEVGSVGDAIYSVVAEAVAPSPRESDVQETREQVIRLLDSLDSRDRKIVMARFGMNRNSERLAFHVIAKDIGYSTTRTIQLFHRSIKKMRDVLARLESRAPCHRVAPTS